MEKMIAQSSDNIAFSGFSMHSKHLSLHRDSRTISKLKPKIRIIHIVAPKIIKTDVENFRNLVQRLTGKSAEGKGIHKKKKVHGVATKGIVISSNSNSRPAAKIWTNLQQQDPTHLQQGFRFLQSMERTNKDHHQTQFLCKGEEGNSIGGSPFGGFGELDINFVQDVSQHHHHQFPLQPLNKVALPQFQNMMW
ncbi:OLC1v1001692C1 [Oldenlandia corymbosa var. corymbosa]|uniref:OLC1v1001692C1 n=1 Tax=Oldenlandia corymbosa var. corymbosa TaxID=529605 RepID=A0AAV1D5T0_OLDCO|nr:OLC1v1001692C1 [Oldenlandia corymbosa var. corymbosa]